jgi:hypothetical protein
MWSYYALGQKSHIHFGWWGESLQFTPLLGTVSLIRAHLRAKVGRQP